MLCYKLATLCNSQPRLLRADELTHCVMSVKLSEAVLADAVIANLDHLPRREDVCDSVASPTGAGGLAGLLQVPIQPPVFQIRGFRLLVSSCVA